MLMGQPRIFFSMSRDRLLPQGVSKVHPRFGTPYITTIITGVVVAVFAAIIPIEVVGEMTSIGTLFAFVVACARRSSCCASSGPTRAGRSGCRSASCSRCSASSRAST